MLQAFESQGIAELAVLKVPVRSIEQPATASQPVLDTTRAWYEAGRQLADAREHQKMAGSQQMWAIGDWLLVGESVLFKHLKKARVRTLAAELSTYSRHTLAMAVSVARKYDASMRIEELSWWHHLVVAGLDMTDREMWLRRAVDHGWSPRQLRAELDVQRGRSGPRRAELPRKTINQLLLLRRDDIDQDLRGRLRDWWQREMGGDT
jgi:hypothetical protein